MQAFTTAINYKAFFLTRAAEVVAYSTWNDEFSRQQLREVSQDFPTIKLTDLSVDDLVNLNFGKYGDIKLIPLWLYPILDKSEEVTCIDGSKCLLETIDLDHRGGYLAYGI